MEQIALQRQTVSRTSVRTIGLNEIIVSYDQQPMNQWAVAEGVTDQ